jgi:hypothetical protein
MSCFAIRAKLFTIDGIWLKSKNFPLRANQLGQLRCVVAYIRPDIPHYIPLPSQWRKVIDYMPVRNPG